MAGAPVHAEGKKLAAGQATPEAPLTLPMEGELTIYTVAAWQARIESAFRANDDRLAVIDLSRITEIDTAGLQLLIVAYRTAGSQGRRLRLTAPSPCVCELLQLCQLEHLALERVKARPAILGSDAA